MIITVHRYDDRGRYIDSIELDILDGYPMEYWQMPKNTTQEWLPEYEKGKEIPVFDGEKWNVEPILQDDAEPPVDIEALVEAVRALIDRVEHEIPLPDDVKGMVKKQ